MVMLCEFWRIYLHSNETDVAMIGEVIQHQELSS
jgi:hypothetical protein